MDSYDIISTNFHSVVESIAMSVDEIAGPIEAAGLAMADCLIQDQKIFACGNGVDGSLAQLFATNMLAQHDKERPALPALALSNDCASIAEIAKTSGVQDIYARQLHALGQAGDMLFCINSADGAGNLGRAVQAAHERNMRVVALSNVRDVELPPLIQEGDVLVTVATAQSARTVELQLMIIHCLCSLIDNTLFGSY